MFDQAISNLIGSGVTSKQFGVHKRGAQFDICACATECSLMNATKWAAAFTLTVSIEELLECVDGTHLTGR